MRSSLVAFVAFVAILAALAAAGCRGTLGVAPPESAPQGSAELAELEAIYRARLAEDLGRFGEADVRFMTEMIGHHAQAVAISVLAPARAAEPRIRTLASRIAAAQADEIATMQAWLRERDLPVPEFHIEGIEVQMHGPVHLHDGPGMLPAERLRELDQARGEAFDRLFLEGMIEHHRGALVMVDELLGAGEEHRDPLVFRLAAEIHAEQMTEIARMEEMLLALSSADAPITLP